MYKRRIAVCVSVIMILTLSVLVASNYPSKSTVKELEQPAKFVLSSWDFPDEYGQGIEKIMIYENSTGSWLLFETSWYHNGTEIYEWNASVAIKLRVSTLFNETLTGAVDTTDGKRFQRHNVTVTSAGSPVFSQQNFTWAYDDNGIYPDLWLYAYDVVLNFQPVGGEIYTVVVTYEIYW